VQESTLMPRSRRRRAPLRHDDRPPFGENLLWGLWFGLSFATIFSLIVLALSALRGSTEFEELDTSAWHIIGLYYATGFGGGLLAGGMRPLLRYRAGAVALGTVVGSGFSMLVWYSLYRPEDVSLVASAVLGAVLGAVFGHQLYEPRRAG
jgi:hypothetical protein